MFVVEVVIFFVLYFFFFKQKTAYEMRISDWSSDVCSSDLAAIWTSTDTEARKRGEQTGLDTLVVHALNDANWMLGAIWLSVSKLTRYVRRLGSTVARLKLKGIDGGPHQRVRMWFNPMQREDTYLAFTCTEL